MKRIFLKELGIDSEVIDKIMSEHGKDIERYKSEIEDYASEIKELKAKTVDSEKAIQDAISKKEEELKQKYADKEKEFKEMQKKAEKADEYSKELESLKQAQSDREYTEAINNYFDDNKIDFTSNFAKEAILSKFKEKKFELKDGKFSEDASKFIEELKKSDEGAFKMTEPPKNNSNTQTYQYTPKGTNTGDVDSMLSQVNSILGL